MTNARRVFLYIVSLVGLALLAIGSQMMLGLLFDLLGTGTGLTGDSISAQQFSLGLAMLLIGGGVWFAFWGNIQKRVAASPAEVGAAFRKLYLNLIQLVAALFVITTAIGVLDRLFSGPASWQFPWHDLATVIVAVLVWYYHWHISEREGHPTSVARTLRRWYVYILSAWGLITLSFSLSQLIGGALSWLPFWQPAIAYGSPWQSIYPFLSTALLGALTWWFFWFYMAKDDAGSTLRQVYFYLLAIPGSAIAGLAALANTLFYIIAFILGARGASYFQFLSWTLPAMLVAVAVWYYHQRLAQDEAAGSPEKHLSARRVHMYLMSFISLGAMVAGVTVLLGVLLELVITAMGGDVIAGAPDWWRQELSLGLALLLVGVPIWLYYWGGVLRLVAGDATERRARSRRIFMYVVLGISIIALVAGMVSLVFQIFSVILQGSSPELLRNIKWSLQAVLVAGPLLFYFWQVLRQDQRYGAEAVTTAKMVTVMASGDAAALAARLTEKLGYKVKALRYAGPVVAPAEVSDQELDALVAGIGESPGLKIMLTVLGKDIAILPYEDG